MKKFLPYFRGYGWDCFLAPVFKLLEALMDLAVPLVIAATVGSTLFMSIVTGSSYLAILIPGEMFQDLYKKFKLAPETLSRTLEDAGTCAVLCYGSMIFALIYGYTGIFLIKAKDGEEE